MSNNNNTICEPLNLVQPCDPCAPTPCDSCPEDCACEEPVYQEDACLSPQGTNCVTFEGDTDACIPVTKYSLLTTALTNIIKYTKNLLRDKLTTNNSLTKTNIDDTCDDKIELSVRISEDSGNALALRSNGLYATPTEGITISVTEGGTTFEEVTNIVAGDGINATQVTSGTVELTVPSTTYTLDCKDISDIFNASTDQNQENSLDQDNYDFIGTDSKAGDCKVIRITPPTSFAVAGNTRVSAFGKMEWYSTLALANTAANSGETVLIFNDSNEILTVKAGVDYFGVGQHTLQGLSANVSTTNLISNLTFTQNSSVSQGKVICSNVVFSANLTVTGTGEISGFDATNELSVINVIQQGVASYFTANCIVGITDNGKIHNSTIINNNPDLPPILGLLQITGSPDSMCSVSNTVVKSKSSVGLYAITPAGSISISNMDIETGLETAVYLHSGSTADLSTGRILIASHINARNIGTPNSVSTFGNACVHLVSNAPVTPIGGTGNSSLATHIHAFSSSGAGINVTGFGMKHCYGFSIDGPGISSFNEENQTYRTEIVECVGESRNFHGLHLEKNVYVAGGTFITRSISSNINPICLADDGTANDNYYIAGVKTIARNTAAYAIRATSAITARISGCQFLNEYLATGVPGIDTANITLNAVTIDIYGNAR